MKQSKKYLAKKKEAKAKNKEATGKKQSKYLAKKKEAKAKKKEANKRQLAMAGMCNS